MLKQPCLRANRLPVLVAASLLLGWLFQACGALAGDFPAGKANHLIEIQSVAVEGRAMPLEHGQSVRLPPGPGEETFGFVTDTNAAGAPIRLRYELEGFDTAWHEEGGEMYLAVRFYDANGDQISQKFFYITGESAGWTGGLDTSPFVHRREKVTVPPQAANILVVISSAGPPATVGIYAVHDLVVERVATTNEPAKVLLRSPFGPEERDSALDPVPRGWVRDGTRPSMAKVVEVGQNSTVNALAILDNDRTGHAEWHNIRESAPEVTPGSELAIDWDEMFSMGLGDLNVVHYPALPAGNYRFRVIGVTIMGTPTGVEASLGVMVPLPFWKTLWFWGAVLALIILALAASRRYVVIQRMQREMVYLKQQQVVEQERVRIAQDIHDDLGARVTQISLFSAMAHRGQDVPEKARADFDKISRMTRELVSALYETVWAVNPENDNLDALGNFLCQMVNQLCEQAQFRCRLDVRELPRDIQVSSQVRHNIIMTVKEAVNNVIKHAGAAEVSILVTFEEALLNVSIKDDGRGFQVTGERAGNGLTNMKRRMADIGGNLSIESQPGRGTTVRLRLVLKAVK